MSKHLFLFHKPEQPKVNLMLKAPTAIRAIKKEDPSGALITGYDTTSLKKYFRMVSAAMLQLSFGLWSYSKNSNQPLVAKRKRLAYARHHDRSCPP
jgi:hypothetical protein